MNYTDKPGEKAAVLAEELSFNEVLDGACERLWDKKVELSIRRIKQLDEYLILMERELTTLITGTAHEA
ncbi:MAG: hypothetical protein LBH70_10355 [Spirochaetaceae bacterium]|jgi:hypothetical protein|nr:hypothetical protein [Spirochaetaceae bacterium]